MSMVYCFINEDSTVSIMYDSSSLTEEDKQRALQLLYLPDKSTEFNTELQDAALMYNKDTQEIYWIYIDKLEQVMEIV